MEGPGSLDRLKDREKVAVLESRIQFQNETIENQKKQIDEYKNDINQLKNQVEKFSSSIQSQTGVIVEQQRTLKDQETTILQQQMNISELQKELIDLQRKLEESTKELVGMEEKIRERIDKFKLENIGLKKDLEEQNKHYSERIAELEDTIKEIREKNIRLEKKEKQFTEITDQISTSDSSSLKKRILDMEKAAEQANSTISNLEKELQKIQQKMDIEIKVRDVKITEYERLMRKQGVSAPSSTNMVFDKEEASKTIISIFSKTKSNAMIFLPDIRVLHELDFENIKPTTRIQIAVPIQQDKELINQLVSKSNLEIRDYTEGLIWGIIRDNEELLLAPLSEKKEPSGLIVKGDAQIEMFGTIMRSTWTRLKRV
ncbi:MAG: hypothetical protein ACFFD2_30885 [Promethearchaeota archaeon]